MRQLTRIRSWVAGSEAGDGRSYATGSLLAAMHATLVSGLVSADHASRVLPYMYTPQQSDASDARAVICASDLLGRRVP